MAEEVVAAYFKVQFAGNDANATPFTINISGSQQFYIGRNHPGLSQKSKPDLTISKKHLKIHYVLYEQDPIAGIPPFVYVTDLSTNGTFLKKCHADSAVPMDRKSGSILLDDGDELRLSENVTLLYCSNHPIDTNPLTPIQQREKEVFASRYLLTNRVLGVGGFGKVLVAVNQNSQRQLACKVINRPRLNGQMAAPLRMSTSDFDKTKKRWSTRLAASFREFNILKDLSHPNIINIEKVFCSPNSTYIFQELVVGGDLFSYIEYKGHLCDVDAAVVVRQILKGVQYLHEQEIIHRDLKPDNVLMTSLDDGARIVITDFGNARFLPEEQDINRRYVSPKQRMFSLVGTLEYAAPEIHGMNRAVPAKEGYSKSVDMWSIGAMTATLFSGEVIFTNRSHPDYEHDQRQVILTLASECDLGILDDESHEVWKKVGSRPKDFIKNLLVLQEDSRMTATEALAHSWFSNDSHTDAFDALYERSICDWKPPRKVFRLVESIPESPTNLASAFKPEETFSRGEVSHFFSQPSQRVPACSVHDGFSSSQFQRDNTTLPSILEDYKDLNGGVSQQLYTTKGRDSGNCSTITKRSHRNFTGTSMCQLTSDPAASGMYSVKETRDGKDSERYGHSGSLNESWNDLDRQGELQNYSTIPRTLGHTPEAGSDTSIVYETPIQGEKRHHQSPVTRSVSKRRRFTDRLL